LRYKQEEQVLLRTWKETELKQSGRIHLGWEKEPVYCNRNEERKEGHEWY
jgi:hypothetical protein